MTHEQIIAGLRTLSPSDFDYNNIEARGWEHLSELTDALMDIPDNREGAIPELFNVMERMPDADLGSPGPLFHTLEKLNGYENELVRSVRRQPSLLGVWMVNRILNTNLPEDERRAYMVLLDDALAHPNAPKTVREDTRGFIELQRRKTL